MIHAAPRASHRYFGHAFSTLVAHASRLVVAVFLPPFVIRRIGASGYGLTVMVTSTMTFIALLQLGLPQAAIRYLAERFARDDVEGANKVYSSAVAMMAGASIVAAVAVAWVAFHPGILGQVGVDLSRGEIQYTILALGTALVLSMPLMIGEASLMARREFLAHSSIHTGTTILRAVAVLVLLPRTEHELLVYVAVTAISTWAPYAAAFGLQRALRPHVTFRRSSVDAETGRTLVRHGGAVLVTTLAWLFLVNVGYVIIGRYRGAEQLTFYSLALVWSGLLQGVATSFSQVLLADAAGRSAGGDASYLGVLVLRSSKFLLVCVAPVITFLVLFRRELIATWLGPGFQATADLMVPVLLGELFTIANSPTANIAVVTGMVNVALKWNIGLAAISATALLTGVTRAGWGVHEAALLYGVTAFVRGGIVYPALMARHLGTRLSRYLARLYVRPAAASVLTGALVAFVRVDHGWAPVVAAAAFTGAVGWALGYVVGLDPYERGVVVSLCHEIARRIRGRHSDA